MSDIDNTTPGLITLEAVIALKENLEQEIQTAVKNSSSSSSSDSSSTSSTASEVTEETVAGWGFTKNTGTYSKPEGGIPKVDLDAEVQGLLDKTGSSSSDFDGTPLTESEINSIVSNIWG